MSMVAPETATVTEHGILVPLGHFARQVGLLDAVGRIPFEMKTVAHSPGDKLAELLCHICGGGMHLAELERSAHPLVEDAAVAEAWGQTAFASASGVNALLVKATPPTVAAVQSALNSVLAPFRQRVLRQVTSGWIVVDLDLMGLVVSDQATTYEGADYGYMGETGKLGKGYQFARAQLSTARERLVLGGFLHPGHTLSTRCVAELVGVIEATLGRPRRRVELLTARLEALRAQVVALEARLARWEKDGRPRRRQGEFAARLARLREEVRELEQRRATLEAENRANPAPRRIILRGDAGFGTAEHLAWLYEQGYSVVAKVHSPHLARVLQAERGLRWEKISKNGFIAASARTQLGDCPYPLRLFACKQWRGDGRPEHWSALATTPDLTAADWSARRVGVCYNGRQTMEAGIKESKGIFASRHLPTRQRAGIALYQELVLFAQNFLRWFRRQALGNTLLAAAGVKELVQIGAKSRASVARAAYGLTLTFLGAGPWQGLAIALRTRFSYQLPLPGFDPCVEAQP
jgi:BMFP domain-containing protein YqiC